MEACDIQRKRKSEGLRERNRTESRGGREEAERRESWTARWDDELLSLPEKMVRGKQKEAVVRERKEEERVRSRGRPHAQVPVWDCFNFF